MHTEPAETHRAEGTSLGNSDVPTKLVDVVSVLRGREVELAGRGVIHLTVFGSLSRGENRPGSDIDMIVDISEDAAMSLTGFARLRMDLEELLGQPVDLAEWRTLPPRLVARARRDAVKVF